MERQRYLVADMIHTRRLKLVFGLILVAVLVMFTLPAQGQFRAVLNALDFLSSNSNDTTTGDLTIQGKALVGYGLPHATQDLMVRDSLDHAYVIIETKQYTKYPILGFRDSTGHMMSFRMITEDLHIRNDANITIMSFDDALENVAIPNGNLDVDGFITGSIDADEIVDDAVDDGDLDVAAGGTGASSFTANGVLLGNSAGDISATSALTNGQLLIGNTGSPPSLAQLTGTTDEIEITNGAGTVEIGTDPAIPDTQWVRDAVDEGAIDIDMYTGNVTFAGEVGQFNHTKRLPVDSAYIAIDPDSGDSSYVKLVDYPSYIHNGDSLGMYNVATHFDILYHPMRFPSTGKDTVPFFGVCTPYPDASWEAPLFQVSHTGEADDWFAFRDTLGDSITPPVFNRLDAAFINTDIDSVYAFSDVFLFQTLDGTPKLGARVRYYNNSEAIITTDWRGDHWAPPDSMNYIIDSVRSAAMGLGGAQAILLAPFMDFSWNEEYFLYFGITDSICDPACDLGYVMTLCRWKSQYADSLFEPDTVGAYDDGYTGSDTLGGCLVMVEDSATNWLWHCKLVRVSPYQKILLTTECKKNTGGDDPQFAIRESLDGGRTWTGGKVLLVRDGQNHSLRQEGFYIGGGYVEDDHLWIYPIYIGEDTLINDKAPTGEYNVHHVFRARVDFGDSIPVTAEFTDTLPVVIVGEYLGNADGAPDDSFFVALPQFDLNKDSDTTQYMLRDSAGPTMADDTDFVMIYWECLPENLISVDTIILFWRSAADNLMELDTAYLLGSRGPQRASAESAIHADSVFKVFDLGNDYNVGWDSLKLVCNNTDFSAREPMALMIRIHGDAGYNFNIARSFAICRYTYVKD
jgi:hypothetical protein